MTSEVASAVGSRRPIRDRLTERDRYGIGKQTFLNLSKSGASVSKRAGRVSLSSRGRGSIRLLKGLSYRFKL